MRIDKYIWCVRLMKTRSMATRECNAERVLLNDKVMKSSKEVAKGDEIALKNGPVYKRYEVLDIPKSRVGAKLVSGLIKEVTPWEDLELLESIRKQNEMNRQIGIQGRPTKKSRRDMERFLGDND